jgi:hypothetical protein
MLMFSDDSLCFIDNTIIYQSRYSPVMDKSGPKLIATMSKNYRNLSNMQLILEILITLIRTGTVLELRRGKLKQLCDDALLYKSNGEKDVMSPAVFDRSLVNLEKEDAIRCVRIKSRKETLIKLNVSRIYNLFFELVYNEGFGRKDITLSELEVNPDMWFTLVKEKIFSTLENMSNTSLQQPIYFSKIPSFNDLVNIKRSNSSMRKYIVHRTVARIAGAIAARLYGLTINTADNDFEKRERVALKKIAEIVLEIGSRNPEIPFSLRIDYNGKPKSVENSVLMYWPEVTKILVESIDPFVEEIFGVNINSEDRDNLARCHFDRLQEETKKYFAIFWEYNIRPILSGLQFTLSG